MKKPAAVILQQALFAYVQMDDTAAYRPASRA